MTNDSDTNDRPKDDAPLAETKSSLADRTPDGLPSPPLQRDRLVLWMVAVVLGGVFAYVSWRYVGTVVLGVFAYYVTRPVFARINNRIESRTAAVAVSLLTVALPVLLLVAWTGAVAVRSLSGVLDGEIGDQIAELAAPYVDVPTVASDLTRAIRTLLDDPTRLADLNITSGISQAFDVLVVAVGELFAIALHAFIVLILVFYLLRDDYRIAEWIRSTVAPSESVLERYFTAVDRDLKNVFFGNILNALLTGFLAVVTYALLNVVAPEAVNIPEPVLVGLLVGAASLVPVIGIKLLTVPISLYLFGRALLIAPETLWFPVTFVVVSFVVVDYIPDQLLRPYVSGRTLHVGAVMLAYTIGPILFGWYGIFLGPLILVVMFEFGRIVVPWLIDPEEADGPPVLSDTPAAETNAPEPTADAPTDTTPDASEKSTPTASQDGETNE